MQHAGPGEEPASNPPEQRSFKTKASRYFIRTPSFASFRSSPAAIETNSCHSEQDTNSSVSRLKRVQRSVSAFASRLPLINRTLCPLLATSLHPLNSVQGIVPDLEWSLLALLRGNARSATKSHLRSDRDGRAPVALTMCQPAHTRSAKAQTSTCLPDQYSHHPLPSHRNENDLSASQIQALVPSTDLRAIKTSALVTVENSAGADSDTVFRNALKL